MPFSLIDKKLIYIIHVMGVDTNLFGMAYRKNDSDIQKTIRTFLKKPLPHNNNCLNSILHDTEENGIKILNIGHKKYPKALKNIPDIAPVLFYKGDKILEDLPKIAIVGTRHATKYGKQAAEYFGRQLSEMNIAVISGMALGVDGYAQKAALDKNGGTIGVLGCGICNIYPKSNRYLYCDILKNGSIISEYLPHSLPQKRNFPWRNRIISGLSAGVIVIESDSRGGALITANFALNQGREVFAVPGSIFSKKSRGTNCLIRQGARPATGIEDILNEVNFWRSNDLFI